MESEVDNILIASIAKAIFYICMTVAICFLFSTCTVDSDIIVQCETSCKTSGSKMKSVTARECECESYPEIKSSQSTWVLP